MQNPKEIRINFRMAHIWIHIEREMIYKTVASMHHFNQQSPLCKQVHIISILNNYYAKQKVNSRHSKPWNITVSCMIHVIHNMYVRYINSLDMT